MTPHRSRRSGSVVLLRRVLLNLTETKTGNESDLNSKISRDLPWSNGYGEPMMAAGYIQMQNHDVARDLVCIVMNEMQFIK